MDAIVTNQTLDDMYLVFNQLLRGVVTSKEHLYSNAEVLNLCRVYATSMKDLTEASGKSGDVIRALNAQRH